MKNEYTVSQGISGFGSEPVILNWESPSPGSSTLKIFVDFEQQVDESLEYAGDARRLSLRDFWF